MYIYRTTGEPDTPALSPNCSGQLICGSSHVERGNHFFTARCKDDKLCGRSSVWVLVPKRAHFRTPPLGIIKVAMFQVESVKTGFIIRLRDQAMNVNLPRETGQSVKQLWPARFSQILLDLYTPMPNANAHRCKTSRSTR